MKRKTGKLISFLAAVVMIICISLSALAAEIDLTALSDAELEELIEEARAELADRRNDVFSHKTEAILPSPDKYTWYVRDYVGRNAASFGYTSLGGDRLERYGSGYLEFVFVSEDGRYVDIDDEDVLKQYVVTGQNIRPNTEMKLAFMTNSEGEEYGSLVDYQSIGEIDLSVRRVDGTAVGEAVWFDLIPITPSPDKYTWHIKNYVGKNAASFGYTSLGGNRMDEYGDGRLVLNFVADDGVYLDPMDEELLKNYVVVSQDIEPDSEMRITYMTDSEGNEYGSLIDSQTYEGITLRVRRLNPDTAGTGEQAGAGGSETGEGDRSASGEAGGPETGEQAGVGGPAAGEQAGSGGSETGEAAASDEAAGDGSGSGSEAGGQRALGEKAAAAEDGTVYICRDVRYILLEDGSAEICGYNGQKDMVTIPSEVDGHEVTSIGDHAFEGCTWIEGFIIWAGPVYIGTAAFKDCISLEDISIPSSVETIKDSAFEGCTDLETVILWADPKRIEKNTFRNCTSLTDFSVPSSVEVIGESAFEGCTSMETVILWGSPTIESSAFRSCTSLTDISISSGTDRIGDHAFDGCTSLESVIIWGTATEIGEDAFANCPKLTDIIQ